MSESLKKFKFDTTLRIASVNGLVVQHNLRSQGSRSKTKMRYTGHRM